MMLSPRCAASTSLAARATIPVDMAVSLRLKSDCSAPSLSVQCLKAAPPRSLRGSRHLEAAALPGATLQSHVRGCS